MIKQLLDIQEQYAGTEKYTKIIDLEDLNNRKPKLEIKLKDLFKNIDLELDGLTDLKTRILEDPKVMNNHFHSIVVYISTNIQDYWVLSTRWDEMFHKSSNFYVLPLIEEKDYEDEYYVLNMNLNHVHLFKVQNFEYEENMIENDNLKDIDSYIDSEKSMQKSGKDDNRVYHGHGSSEDEADSVKKEFLDKVTSEINDKIDHSQLLIIATPKELESDLTSKINNDEVVYLQGNYDDTQINSLMEKVFDRYRSYKSQKIQDLHRDAKERKGMVNKNEVFEKSLLGSIDELFIKKGFEKSVDIIESGKSFKEDENGKFDIANTIATRVVKLGGEVFISEDFSDDIYTTVRY